MYLECGFDAFPNYKWSIQSVIQVDNCLNYLSYLEFFERARTEWLRRLGVDQGQLQTQSDCIFVVSEVQLRYLQAARLDDLLTITVQTTHKGRASLELAQQAWRGQTLLAEGRVRVGCVRYSSLKPCRIPDAINALL